MIKFVLPLLFSVSVFASDRPVPASLFEKRAENSSAKIYDLFVKGGVSEARLKEAFAYFDLHVADITNRRFIVMVDFSKNMSNERFYLLDLRSGRVEKTLVAHGVGSDPDRSGRAARFSDVNGSQMSSVGFYLTMNAYTGIYGYSLRLKGLSATNAHVLERSIVLHGYSIGGTYTVEACRWSKIRAGRPQSQKYCGPTGAFTQGCFGVPLDEVNDLVDRLKGGTLMYAFGSSNR